jgi:hypothetical protein
MELLRESSANERGPAAEATHGLAPLDSHNRVLIENVTPGTGRTRGLLAATTWWWWAAERPVW